jgi:hypothetical protein
MLKSEVKEWLTEAGITPETLSHIVDPEDEVTEVLSLEGDGQIIFDWLVDKLTDEPDAGLIEDPDDFDESVDEEHLADPET